MCRCICECVVCARLLEKNVHFSFELTSKPFTPQKKKKKDCSTLSPTTCTWSASFVLEPWQSFAKNTKNNEEELCAALMEVICHVWGVIPISQLQEIPQAKNELISVVLPSLKGKFHGLMERHNEIAMDIFTAYVQFCAKKRAAEGEDVKRLLSLPGSSHSSLFSFEGGEEEDGCLLDDLKVRSTTRSPFAGLSGHGDVYEVIIFSFSFDFFKS